MNIVGEVAKLLRVVQKIPSDDIKFCKASDSHFRESMEALSGRLTRLTNSVLEYTNNGTLADEEDYDTIVDALDALLEKADVCLDNASGATREAPMETDTAAPGARPVGQSTALRPQLKFKDKIDNSNAPFVRKITHKPNARRPLDFGLPSSSEMAPEMSEHMRSLGITDANSSSFRSLPHPYEYEISNIEYPPHMMQISPEKPFLPLSETHYEWVETEESLIKVMEILAQSTEIAIDIEHHDFRSYQGFSCILQLSTREHDFVIDALALRDKLHVLNEVFTDPTIVKILHGAESDIVWLQKDFGVYIVNMFDTYHASHVLEMAQHGYAFLLKHYCDIKTDKKFQLADWRKRPLSPQMIEYCRIDTHFLPYIYDRMKNELIQREPEGLNLLRVTLERSARTSLKVYEKDIYDADSGLGPSGWRNALIKYNRSLSPVELKVFKALHQWRDHIARQEDESLRYVMPMHVLFNLSKRMPVDGPGVLSCCNPPTPMIRLYATDIAILIDQAIKAEASRLDDASESKTSPDELKERTHVRFDDSVLDQKDEDDQAEAMDEHVEMAPKRAVKSAIQVPFKHSSSVFLESIEKDQSEASRLAASIWQALVLLPTQLQVLPSSKDVEMKDSFAVKSEEPRKEEPKTNRNEVIVLSEKNKDKKTVDIDELISLQRKQEENDVVEIQQISNKARVEVKEFDLEGRRSAVAEYLENPTTVQKWHDDIQKQEVICYDLTLQTRERVVKGMTLKPRGGNKSMFFSSKK